ncbi:hypothetical protein DY000_02042046 [Brassica cretica]|uniref:Uncharacterized protein n=1 Tax=Brassica cretica TaxID=69181 RepID=A0ABQ7BFI9_BRACR|nr:hypothetical protein DY000_02042046 [Brassica cretica]
MDAKSMTFTELISHHDQSFAPVADNYRGSYLTTLLSSGGCVQSQHCVPDTRRTQPQLHPFSAYIPDSYSSRSRSDAFPIRRVPFQLAPQHASVLARSSSRSSLFQLVSRPARGSLGGPVLQSSKPKGNSNFENMNRIWLFCKD